MLRQWLAYLCGAAAAMGIAPAHGAAPKLVVSRGWDFGQQYSSEAEWRATLEAISARATEFSAMHSWPIASAPDLVKILSEEKALRGQAGRLARFALISRGLDDRQTDWKDRLEAARNLEAKVEGSVGWVNRAIAALPRQTLAAWIASSPDLGWFAQAIDHARRRPLPPADNDALAAELERNSFAVSAAAEDILGSLKATSTAGAEPLTFDNWPVVRRSKDRDARQAADIAFLGAVHDRRAALANLLTLRVRLSGEAWRLRGYATPFDGYFGDYEGLPAGAEAALAAAMRANRGSLVDHAKLIGRLQDGSPRFDDLFAASPAALPGPFPIDGAAETVLASFAPFGPAYTERLRQRFATPWLNWAPDDHKSAFGVYWQVGGGHPYGVFNYDGSYASSRTLAGQAALMMFYSDVPPEKQAERREDDYPVLSNAVWYVGQMLYNDERLKRTASADEKVAILYEDAFRIWTIFVLNAAATELEQRIVGADKAGKPLSAEQLESSYLSILRDYYPSGSGIDVPERWGSMALTYPNLYYSEVPTEWAYAMAAGCAIAERVGSDRSAAELVARPFSRPGDITSNDLLLSLGIDLAKTDSYGAVFRRLDRDVRIIDEIERQRVGARKGASAPAFR